MPLRTVITFLTAMPMLIGLGVWWANSPIFGLTASRTGAIALGIGLIASASGFVFGRIAARVANLSAIASTNTGH